MSETDSSLSLSCQANAVEALLADLSDPGHDLHRLNSLNPKIPIISYRGVSPLLKFKGGVCNHLLTSGSAERLSPCSLPGIVLSLKVLVALGAAEPKDLAVVSDKHHTMSRVDTARAEPALFDSHFAGNIKSKRLYTLTDRQKLRKDKFFQVSTTTFFRNFQH